MDGRLRVLLLWTQHGAWELRMVDRIWEVLCFQTKCISKLIFPTALAHFGAIKEVASVKLDAWLGGKNLKHPTRGRFLHSRRQTQATELFLI